MLFALIYFFIVFLELFLFFKIFDIKVNHLQHLYFFLFFDNMFLNVSDIARILYQPRGHRSKHIVYEHLHLCLHLEALETFVALVDFIVLLTLNFAHQISMLPLFF